MSPDETLVILRRLAAIWPRKTCSEDTDAEWSAALRDLGFQIANSAVNLLRDTATFPPSIADLRAAYREAQLRPSGQSALPAAGQDDTAARNCELYGSAPERWIFCWRCDQALTLAERCETAGFDPARGLYHLRCPRPGSRPTIPLRAKVERDERLQELRIQIGPRVDPAPYSGTG